MSRGGGTTVETGRSARKREAIFSAARTVFLRGGYANASMDEVAALAAVSKQTVYKHFADKKQLFTEVVLAAMDEAERRGDQLMGALADTEDVSSDLRRFARRLITVVMQPPLLQMRRVIIGEADRFPELASTWYARGPERSHATLADRFAELAQDGTLHVSDPLLAAQHFHWLVLSIPLNKAMFSPDHSFTAAELERYADQGVNVFLTAYGPHTDHAGPPDSGRAER